MIWYGIFSNNVITGDTKVVSQVVGVTEDVPGSRHSLERSACRDPCRNLIATHTLITNICLYLRSSSGDSDFVKEGNVASWY